MPKLIIAKSEQNTYAIAGIYTNEKTLFLLQERITSLLLNHKEYIAFYGMDSFCMASVHTDYHSSTELLNTAEAELIRQTDQHREHCNRPHYAQLISARNKLYISDEETFGIAYHQDIIRQRMMKMIWLLTATNLDLSVIVNKCGYDDYGYCLRLFRQFTGYSPNKYRKL